MTFNAALHPRGPDGRFTRSFARVMSGKDKQALAAAKTKFNARPPFAGPGDAGPWLSGLSTSKNRPPGQLDRALASLQAANKQLRAGKTGGAEANAVDAAMTPLPEDITLHRVVPAAKFGNATPADLKGMIVSDAGFFPAAVTPPAATPGDVTMSIDVPAGTKAAPSPDTGELILESGLVMAVTDVQPAPNGSVDMHLTTLPGADAQPPAAKAAPAKKLTFSDLAKAAKKAAPPAKAAPAPPAPAKKLTFGDLAKATKKAVPAPSPPPTPAPAKAVPAKAPAVPPAAKKAAAKAAAKKAPAKKAAKKAAPAAGSFDQRLANARRGGSARQAAPRSLMRPGRPPLTNNQRDALEEYQGDSYTAINEQLRGGDRSAQATTWINRIDAAIGRSRLEDDVEAWRGIGNAQRLFGDRLTGDLTGMEWREDAYVSTSTNREVSEDFAGNIPPGAVLMRVLVPTGTGAIELSGEEYESEVMLERGLRMRVVADRGTDEDGVRLIDVEVIHDDE
jgi:hypothetical protein